MRENIDLGIWLPKFIDDFCQSGQAKPDSFDLQIQVDSAQIQFDAGHLAHILTNRLTNARVHAQAGKNVEIKVTSNANSTLDIEIADQGPGIPAEILDQIFEPFYTTSHEGSGLGLYIVGQLCELNNASISVHRNQYNGSSFLLHMTRHPLNRPEL